MPSIEIKIETKHKGQDLDIFHETRDKINKMREDVENQKLAVINEIADETMSLYFNELGNADNPYSIEKYKSEDGKTITIGPAPGDIGKAREIELGTYVEAGTSTTADGPNTIIQRITGRIKSEASKYGIQVSYKI